MNELLLRLNRTHSLTLGEYERLIVERSPRLAEEAAALGARSTPRRLRRQGLYPRAYRGRQLLPQRLPILRHPPLKQPLRALYPYRGGDIRLLPRGVFARAFRTFVLQGGEGIFPADKVCRIVARIKREFPDCAVTLSLGEFPREEYQRMFDSGADRYLLRHETADKAHYERLHPPEMSFDNRMRCLRDLRDIGYQVGCGFMVGSPFQTAATLAKDLKFIEEFSPDMCGIGPFIPQKDTPFGDLPSGTAELTVYLLSLIRLIKPNILLPATTALGTIDPLGREKGISAGANVVMPNLSPVSVRRKYALYDNKICTGDESAQCKSCLAERISSVGCEIVTDRGDIIK